MRAEIIRKSMQKVVPKRGVQIKMGHIPTLFHNLHAGDENTSVMRPGPELGFNAQRTITANDAAALTGKY